ncbi:hypothetical protein AWB72_02544 [Caballeronia concitans]|uniref:LysR family transcriptional regulator n=1 Tax=Caballeronia concitans TaxID=1777133 RepID=A0A658QX21_9BURK|nr:hypothetical protein BurMR1_4833 [Burkholderia sp. MR1]SAL30224.1 hypothetical protein AWB72_02544 [Caballeronia concitans]
MLVMRARQPVERQRLGNVAFNPIHQLRIFALPFDTIATILPRVIVQSTVDEGVLRAHTITSPPIVRHVIQVTHPKRPIGPAAQALIRESLTR